MFKSMDEVINNTVKLGDGRVLEYAEYGDANGKAVFHFHGSGGSRLEHPLDLSILTKIGIRFISTDRPGHGISDPQPNRNLLDWAAAISELATKLGIDMELLKHVFLGLKEMTTDTEGFAILLAAGVCIVCVVIC